MTVDRERLASGVVHKKSVQLQALVRPSPHSPPPHPATPFPLSHPTPSSPSASAFASSSSHSISSASSSPTSPTSLPASLHRPTHTFPRNRTSTPSITLPPSPRARYRSSRRYIFIETRARVGRGRDSQFLILNSQFSIPRHDLRKRAKVERVRSLYSTEARVHSDRWLPSVSSGDPTSKLCDPALFLAALTRASRFLPFKLPSFLFLSLQLSFWFLQFIEVVVRTSDDRKSPDRRLKFSYLFVHTCRRLQLFRVIVKLSTCCMSTEFFSR